MQREGIFREMELGGHYEKPGEKAREKAEAVDAPANLHARNCSAKDFPDEAEGADEGPELAAVAVADARRDGGGGGGGGFGGGGGYGGGGGGGGFAADAANSQIQTYFTRASRSLPAFLLAPDRPNLRLIRTP
jgi:hypothetical protein